MAKNVTTLPVETLQSLDGTENVVMFDSAEGKRSTLSTLSDYAVRKHKTTGMTQTIYEQGETLKQEITELKAAVGTPLVANTASAMTDQTKIYVYTGTETGYSQGHWYYWNGSAWTDGGVYQATAVETDKTLTLSDKPADSKTVGDALATKATPTEVDSKISENIDSTLSTSGKSADAKVTGDSLKAKAEAEGAVSMAKALVGGKYTLDQSPYHYRQSPDAGALDEKIVGGTLGWNQLIDENFDFGSPYTDNGMTFTRNANGSITVNGTIGSEKTNAYCIIANQSNIVVGHKYLMTTGNSNPYINMWHNTTSGMKPETIIAITSVGNGFYLRINQTGTTVSNVTIRPQVVDLTTIFGPTIADYIYSLEQSSAGAGVDWVRQYIDLDKYPEYCEPTLKSVEGLQSRDVVGFNQWDEEWEVGGLNTSNGVNWNTNTRIRSKNYISIKPSTGYYISYPTSGVSIDCCFYDVNKAFVSATNGANRVITVPSNAYYLRFATYAQYGTTYNHDICINLSDPSRNGEYEPYEKHSYPLDSDIVLRGVPKLVTDHIEFDGDKYRSDGTVERRYGIETYDGTENWAVSNNGTLYRAYILKNDAKPSVNLFGSYVFANNVYQASYPDVWKAFINASNTLVIGIPDTITDATAWKNYLASHPLTLVYELAAHTTEPAQPYQSPQLAGSTEEYVTTGVVPVGHESRYYEDITGKVNNLPSDFSTLIAPVEKSFTATRNYTVGSFVIVNNQLYKVSSAISSGGTITPNSNVTATTIMAEILALA